MSYTREAKVAVSYSKDAKPKVVDYLEREQGDYILLEHGGKIIIRRAWRPEVEPTATYSKDAKPSIP